LDFFSPGAGSPPTQVDASMRVCEKRF
jgi:hypothetical protein